MEINNDLEYESAIRKVTFKKPRYPGGKILLRELRSRFSGITLDKNVCSSLIIERINEKSQDPASARNYDTSAKKSKAFEEKMEICNLIFKKRWRCTRSPFALRLDSNFTNLSANIRARLVLDGEPSAEIDIRSAQPSLLYKVLHEQYAHSDGIIEELKQLQQHLKKDLNQTFATNLGLTRSQAKIKFISWMFAPVEATNYQDFRQIFSNMFPLLSQKIDQIKSGEGFWVQDKFYQPHIALAQMLQKEESNFMIDIVCPKVLRLEPNFSFFTVHDSIVVPKSKADQVCKLVNKLLLSNNIPTIAQVK